MPRLVLLRLKTMRPIAAAVVLFAPLLASPYFAQAQTFQSPAKNTVAGGDSFFRVTIRPRPRIGAPPSLQDMVIRSADGNVMYFVEWLLRPKTGSATGQYGDYNQSYFDIGPPVKEDLGAKYLPRGRGDFAMVMGRHYLGMSFEEIAQEIGYDPSALVARFDAGRSFYRTASAESYDPLYSTYGKFNFDNTPCNPWLGVICGQFKSR